MIRKHTRRTARAAFATATGAALLIGGAGSAIAGTSTTPTKTVVLGTKDFPEEFILGQLYKQALEAKGFKVQYKENVGSTEIIDTALTSGKINVYPEYTGTIVSVIAKQKKVPHSAKQTFSQAKAFEEKRGYTLFAPTPFFDADAVGVLTSAAKANKLRTIGDLKKLGSKATIAARPEYRTRDAGLVGLKRVYGLTQLKFKPVVQLNPYAILDSKQVLAADVFTTDPPLGSGKYTVLKDTKNLFGYQNVAPVVSKKLASELGPKFRSTMDAVSATLTLKAIIAMNTAVSINKKTPKSVASQFLKANKLV